MSADDRDPPERLWDLPPAGEVAPQDRLRVVAEFLERSRAWGTDREIPTTLRRLAERPTSKDAARLHAWTTWVEFLDHALAELRDGRLDDWFRDESGV